MIPHIDIIGEHIEQRKAGMTEAKKFITSQLKIGLQGLSERSAKKSE